MKHEVLVNREELRRLEKAARDKDKKKLIDWMSKFEDYVRQEYEDNFKEELGDAVANFMLAVAYTLRFSEETEFGQKRLSTFMEDLYSTIDLYRTGEYKPEEYKESLEKAGVFVNEYDYCRLYREQKELHNKRLGDSMNVCGHCKECKYNVDVRNPETDRLEMSMCTNRVVLDKILDGFDKRTCQFKEERN